MNRIFLVVALLCCTGGILRATEPAGPAVGELRQTLLEPYPGKRGPTLFAAMPPGETGVIAENRYADPRMWAERYHEFGVGAIGTGVAVGDYDADGLPDLFVVSKTESCRLFRNRGNWKFQDVTEAAGVMDDAAAAGEWKQGASFVDVNNDGRLDIYVCRFNAPNLLYINQGDGTFKEEAEARGLGIKDGSSMAAFCDFDRDGWLDVYVQTNLLDVAAHPNGQRDRLLRNRGDGIFVDVTARSGIEGETQGHSVTWWDYDADGWPDLYVANDFAPADQLLRNNGDGTFTNTLNHTAPHTPYSSMGADLGDINNDGVIDFLVADMAATSPQKDQRGMADSRARGKEADASARSAPQYSRNALYLNSGPGLPFREVAFLAGLAATDWTWSVRFEDLDNDGRLDLFVTTGMNREQHNLDLLARMMSSESANERVRLMKSSPVFNEPNLAFRNQGDLRFESIGPGWGLDQRGVSFGAAFGDFDGDGDLDLVYSNYESGPTLLRNDSDTGHRITVALRGHRSNSFGIGAVVRIETASGVQVRSLVSARGYLSTSEPILHFGLGGDERIERLTVEWPSGARQDFSDLAVDRRFEITEPREPSPSDARLAETPRGQFRDISEMSGFSIERREADVEELEYQPLLPFRLNRRGPPIAVGDVDGDGIDEIMLGGTTRDGRRLLRVQGPGLTTVTESPPEADLNDGPIVLFDANNDGYQDILITKGGVALPPDSTAYRPQLLLNDRGRTFRYASPEEFPRFSMCAGAAVAADFDRSGFLGVFIGARCVPGEYPEVPRSVLLANRGGKFTDVTDSLAPGLRDVGLVTSALWTDVDDDGWPDLLVAVEWGTIRYWHNKQGQGFEDLSDRSGFSAGGSGWWTSLASADFNRDGKLDYVVGNVGLNTQYQATTDRPALLYYGEFSGSDLPQIIEARWDGERMVPWRSRRDLGRAIPSILRRFPKNDAYARASLADILGAEQLEAARKLTATELRSGVFLSQRDGSHRFEPLPALAQIAPLQGLAAGDFDGDGFADIYALQNSFAPIHAIGRFDGGLSQLLIGDGNGQFTAVAPAKSGLVVPGDARALVTSDLNHDGWPDFLLTRSNASSMAFSNHGVEGRRMFSVRLRGPAGNSAAAGAKVTLVHATGAKQSAEIASGLYSQSGPLCFFAWRADDPPQSIEIRWPGGEVTTQVISGFESSFTIFHPSVRPSAP